MSREERQCCFCGEGVRGTVREPVEVAIAFHDGRSQALRAHIDCIGRRLHSSVPWLSPRDRKETEMTCTTRIFPVFAVRHLDEALDYYEDKLGFAVSWTWGEPVSRAGVALDDIEIQLEGAGHGAPPGPSVVYCQMTGIDAYYEACRARGAAIAMDLGDRPWGMRDFRVIDPSGNRIGFGAVL